MNRILVIAFFSISLCNCQKEQINPVVEQKMLLPKINEVIYSNAQDNIFLPYSKLKYRYGENDMLIKREEFYFSPDKKTFELAYTEEYVYDDKDLLSQIKVKSNTLVYAYDYEYTTKGVIENQTYYSGSNHEKIHGLQMESKGVSVKAAEHYYFEGKKEEALSFGNLDKNENPVYLKHFDIKGQAITEQIIAYDKEKLNPFTAHVGITPFIAAYTYVRKFDILRMAKSLPVKSVLNTLESDINSSTEEHYSYDFKSGAFPETIFITTKNFSAGIQTGAFKSKIEISYY